MKAMMALFAAVLCLGSFSFAATSKVKSKEILDCGVLKFKNGSHSKSAPYVSIFTKSVNGKIENYVQSSGLGYLNQQKLIVTAKNHEAHIQESKDYRLVTIIISKQVIITSKGNPALSAICKKPTRKSS